MSGDANINSKEPWYKRQSAAVAASIVLLLPAIRGIYELGLEIGIVKNGKTRYEEIQKKLNNEYIAKEFETKISIYQSSSEDINATIYGANKVLITIELYGDDRKIEKTHKLWFTKESLEVLFSNNSSNFSVGQIFAQNIQQQKPIANYANMKFSEEKQNQN